MALGLIFTVAAGTVFGVAPAMAKAVTLRLAHSEAVTNIRHYVCLFFVNGVALNLNKGMLRSISSRRRRYGQSSGLPAAGGNRGFGIPYYHGRTGFDF